MCHCSAIQQRTGLFSQRPVIFQPASSVLSHLKKRETFQVSLMSGSPPMCEVLLVSSTNSVITAAKYLIMLELYFIHFLVQLQNFKVTASLCLSVLPYLRLSAWNNPPPTGHIFMKFDI